MEIFKKYLCQRQLVSLRHLRLLKEDSNAKPRPLSPPQQPLASKGRVTRLPLEPEVPPAPDWDGRFV